MLSSIIFKTKDIVTESRKEAIIDTLRASIVNTCKNKFKDTFSEDEKRFIDFRPPPPYRTLPTILYGQPEPNKKQFQIFGYGNRGREIIEKMAEVLKKAENLKFYKKGSKEPFRIVRIKDYELKKNLPFLPSMVSDEIDYYTSTPLIIFDKKKRFNLWFAIKKKLQNNEITKEYADSILKKVIEDSMKVSIKTHLKQHVKDKDYSFVDTIDIKIKEYSFAMFKYHPEQPLTPFLMMKFSSNWTLPMFLGHHTGKGYGMILIDKNNNK